MKAPIFRGYVRKRISPLYGPLWLSECRQPAQFFAERPFIDRHDFGQTRSEAIQNAIGDARDFQHDRTIAGTDRGNEQPAPIKYITLGIGTASPDEQPATINCPKCNGAGCQHDVPAGQPVHGGDIYECYHCEGSGQVPATKKCPECYGDGQKLVYWEADDDLPHKASGWVKCPRCEGRRTVPTTDNY